MTEEEPRRSKRIPKQSPLDVPAPLTESDAPALPAFFPDFVEIFIKTRRPILKRLKDTEKGKDG